MSGFTVEGYNDAPKPCLEDECAGMVEPTMNANVGKCNTCGTLTNWSRYDKETQVRDTGIDFLTREGEDVEPRRG